MAADSHDRFLRARVADVLTGILALSGGACAADLLPVLAELEDVRRRLMHLGRLTSRRASAPRMRSQIGRGGD